MTYGDANIRPPIHDIPHDSEVRRFTPCSQERATEAYPAPDECWPHMHSSLLYEVFLQYPSTKPWST